MSEINTKFETNMRGDYSGETEIFISKERRLFLRIATYKTASRHLVTNASVNTVSEDGRSYTHAMFSDFNKQIVSSSPSRITKKLIEAQHNGVLNSYLDSILTEAKAFYGIT